MVGPRRKKFEVDFRAVPHQFSANYVAFKQLLAQPFNCALCGDYFTPRQSGTLLCSFHPLAHYSTGARATPYLSDIPAPCFTCNDKHLNANLSKRPDYDTRIGDDGITISSFYEPSKTDYATDAIPLRLQSIHYSIGCIAIDHCTSVADVFKQPYVALPLVYLNHLVIENKIDIERERPDGDYTNWMVIKEPIQLTKMLAIAVPYSEIPFIVPVKVVYEAMSLKFGIESLEEGARAARVWNNKSSLSQLQHLHHPKAEHKDRLHRIDQRHVKFAPFIIIARVAQNSLGSKGMRLIDV